MSRDDEGSSPELPGPSGLVDRIDAILALVLILICGALYYVTTGFEQPALFLGDNVLPAEFPQMLLVIIGALALTLPFEHLLERKRHPLIRKARGAPIGFTTWATIGLLVVILALAESLGTILTILVSSLVLPALWGERRWWLLLLYAIAFTAAVTYIFAVVLRVYFEPGLFGITVR
ncbi:MAG: tripartite tricarboxylate transporter TctB family protein [Kiloniellales bacterium]|nr:tripartite tricarboxylate transporter TctB family protein [Kiloniellales bacterium]